MARCHPHARIGLLVLTLARSGLLCWELFGASLTETQTRTGQNLPWEHGVSSSQAARPASPAGSPLHGSAPSRRNQSYRSVAEASSASARQPTSFWSRHSQESDESSRLAPWWLSHHWSNQKPHSEPWSPLSKSTTTVAKLIVLLGTRTGTNTRPRTVRVAYVTDRAATAALKMVIFRPLFSTLLLRCEGSRLTCLSFVLKQVSRQKMILGWSSPLTPKRFAIQKSTVFGRWVFAPLTLLFVVAWQQNFPWSFPMRFSTRNWSRFVVFTFNFLPKLAVEDRLSHTLAVVWMPNKPWSVWTTWTPMSRSILAMAMSVAPGATYPTTETWVTTLGTMRTVLETERAQTSWLATAMTTMTR